MRDSAERLHDIVEAIAAIARYADRDKDTFEKDELLQGWFLRHLQIIGEAARAIPEDLPRWRQKFRGGRSSACEMSLSTDTSQLTPTLFGMRLLVMSLP